MATRRMLASRHLRGRGLEIGALHLPLSLPRTARASYVDYYPEAELRRRLPELANRTIAPVDIVDDGERLATVADASQDFVIANHMIEHCEDPLGTIGHHLRVLRAGGRVYMAVPDKRHTFDRTRRPTSFDHLLRDYAEGPAWSRHGHYAEWARHFEGAPEAEIAARAEYLEEQAWRIHFHVWTRSTFRRMLERCRSELGFPLHVDLVWPNLSEFVAIFTRTDEPIPERPSSR